MHGKRGRINIAQFLRQAARENFGPLGETLFDAAEQAYREAKDRTLSCPNCGNQTMRVGTSRFLCAVCHQTFLLGGEPRPTVDGWASNKPFYRMDPYTGRLHVAGVDGQSRVESRPFARDFRKDRATGKEDGVGGSGRGPRKPRERVRSRKSAPPRDPIADAYTALGLDTGASAEDVKRRHHELALEHHPDMGGDIERMKEINAAADLLAEHLEANEHGA